MQNDLAYKEEPWLELIDGKAVMMSPRPQTNHTEVCGNIYHLFRTHFKGRTCRPFGDGVDLWLDDKNHFIPDAMVVCDPKKVTRERVVGAPDLVVEVLSPSSARYDRGRKKTAYENAGVREYWIISPSDMTVEVYTLQNGRLELDDTYAKLEQYVLDDMTEEKRAELPTAFTSRVFPDMELPLDEVFYRVTI